MEMSIKVAVRICPPSLNWKHLNEQEEGPSGSGKNKPQKENRAECENKHDANNVETNQESLGAKPKHFHDNNEQHFKYCVQPIRSPITPPPGVPPGLVQVGHHTFPVSYALPINCSQNHVYNESVLPLMKLLMEGFDASVVTYGQKGCGKTYTLYGKGFGEGVNEPEHGIVTHCVREIFTHIDNHPERAYTVNITWVEVCRDVIKDLFGMGSIQCRSMADVFHWLHVGYNSNLRKDHSLFSLTLEQRWITREGLIQHRLSTASFTDLGPTERVLMLNPMKQPIGIPKDMGLQALEHVVNILTDPNLLAKINGNVPYNQTALSAMLKDSFGGRAQSLVMLCVSSFEHDVEETLWNMQFAFKTQLIRNTVVINSYSDDNTPVPLAAIMPEVKAAPRNNDDGDNIMLQIAAKQWPNLVSNAEDLLTELVSTDAIPTHEKHQINAWLKSSEDSPIKKQLTVIQEDEELEEAVGGEEDEEEAELEHSLSSEADTLLQENSDQETDNESETCNIDEHLEYLMQNFNTKTDDMIQSKYQDFMEIHPKSVMESLEERPSPKKKQKMEEESEERRRLWAARVRKADGRHRFVTPGSTLSSTDLSKLSRVTLMERPIETSQTEDIFNTSLDLKSSKFGQERIQNKLRKLDTDIEAKLTKIKEIEQTMNLKQNILTELTKNNESSVTSKQKFLKNRDKLEAEYEKTQNLFNKVLTQGSRDTTELECLKARIIHLEQRLNNDVISFQDIAREATQKVKKLQQSLRESMQLRDDLQTKVKKGRQLKEILENQLIFDKENFKALAKVHGSDKFTKEQRKNVKEVQVIKEKTEKTENLQQLVDRRRREGLRYEIRNLHQTQDHLIEQRCSLHRKLKCGQMLSHEEECKLVECDESIEAIDAAIIFKNQLIRGHASIDTSEELQDEEGVQMLINRLNNLSSEEMRTLIQQTFTKAIDLSYSSHTLEKQLMQLEREKDALEWKERMLTKAVRQVSLVGQRQQEMKLNSMLGHHVAEDSRKSSGGSSAEQSLDFLQFCKATNPIQYHQLPSVSAETSSYTSYTDTGIDASN